MATIQQVKLCNGKTTQITWIDHPEKYHVGSIVKLKGEEVWWHIDEAYTVEDSVNVNRNWHVGGL